MSNQSETSTADHSKISKYKSKKAAQFGLPSNHPYSHNKYNISDERLAEFKELFRSRRGIELSDEDALESANKLLTPMEILLRAHAERPTEQNQSQLSPRQP